MTSRATDSRTLPRRDGVASEDSSALDRTRVKELLSEFAGTGLFAELAELFGSETPMRLSDLRSALGAKDAQAVSRIAHQLRGVCLTLAAFDMGELCRKLEIAVGAGALPRAAALVDQLDRAFGVVYASLLRAVDGSEAGSQRA